jgi:uncharacterized delta-60 repeat protein
MANRLTALMRAVRPHNVAKVEGGLLNSVRRGDYALRRLAVFALLWLVGTQSGVTLAQSAQNGFDPGAGAGEPVYAVETQSDGRVLVAGSYTNYDGHIHIGTVRVGPDGTYDPDFVPETNGTVHSLLRLADGKVLVGGGFSEVCGQPRKGIFRLNADGSLDAGFDLQVNGGVFAMAAQADGKVLLAGFFLRPTRALTPGGGPTATSSRSRRRRTARFWSAGTSPASTATRAATSPGSTRTAHSTRISTRGRTASSVPSSYSPAVTSRSAAASPRSTAWRRTAG